MTNHSTKNKRLAKNSIVLYLRMLFTMVIQLYTSRLVLDALGVEDYGIYNVVGGVVILLNSINASLSNANARFIAYEIGAGSKSSLNRLYSCIITIHYIFAIIILIIAETGGLWFVMNKLVIPETRITAARWVYQCAVFSSMITIVSSPYTGLLIAHEKMSAFAFISIFDSVAKLAVAAFLLISPFDRLIVYALLIVLIHLTIRVIYTVYCRRKFDESRYRLIWDKVISKNILSFAGWTLTGNVAFMGSTQGLNILLNMFFGAVVNAARGISAQVQGATRTFVSGFQTAINPQIIKSYSQKDMQRMQILVNMSSRFSFYLMLLVTIPIVIHTRYILNLWLGEVPDYTVEFVRIMLAVGLINTLQNPTMTALLATGDIRNVQLIESVLLLSVVPVAYICLKLFHISPVMVFVIYFIIEFLTQFVRVVLIYPKVRIPIANYLWKILLPIAGVTLFAGGCAVCFSRLFEVTNFTKLIIATLCYIIMIIITIIIMGLNKAEKKYLFNFLKNKVMGRLSF